MAKTVRAADIVRYILKQVGGSIEQLKLQKLLYYCQALSRVWYSQNLFDDPIEAWVNGPVVRNIWKSHPYAYTIDSQPDGYSENLDEDDRSIVNAVMRTYGRYEAWELVRFVHQDAPWIDARRGLAPREHGYTEIQPPAMEQFYREKWSH